MNEKDNISMGYMHECCNISVFILDDLLLENRSIMTNKC